MSKLDGKVISNILKRVHLNGLVDECLLRIKDNLASVQVIDVTNTIAIHSQAEIESDDLTLGLSNLKIVHKFLASTDKPVTYKIKGEKLSLIKSGKDKLNLLMLDEDSVPTMPNKPFNKKEAVKEALTTFKVTSRFREKLIEYQNLLSLESVTISAKENKISLSSTSIREKGFSTSKVAKCESVDEDCSTEIYVSHLIEILKVLDGEEKVIVHLGNDKTLVVECGDDFWALMPIVGV